MEYSGFIAVGLCPEKGPEPPLYQIGVPAVIS